MGDRETTSERPNDRTIALLSLVGVAVFTALAVLVQARALAAADMAFTRTKQVVESPLLDWLGAATGVLVSAELSFLYGLVGCLVLWRLRLGLWSLAPLAFLVPTALELGLKLVIHQPPVPAEYHSALPYPLVTVPTPGAFPSGHALRTGFFGTFLAVLAQLRGGAAGRLGAWFFMLFALLAGYSRVYVGDHWLSDVVAGLVLGAATALPAAYPVARALTASRRRRG